MFLQILSLPVAGHWEFSHQLADTVSQWRQRHGHTVLRIHHSGVIDNPWHLQDARNDEAGDGVSGEWLSQMLNLPIHLRSDIVLTASGRCQLVAGLLPDHTVIALAQPDVEPHQWLHIASLIRHLRLRDRCQPITVLIRGSQMQSEHGDTLQALERSLTIRLACLPDNATGQTETMAEQLCQHLYDNAAGDDLPPLTASEPAR